MKPFATRMGHLSPHYFSTLGAKLAQMQAAGLDVIRLDEGSPDLPPAAHIVQALADSAAKPQHHGYQPHSGTPALREAWAGLYRREYGVDLDPETEVLPLLGSKEGIFNLMMAVVGPGDVVLVPDPGYVTYTRGALFAGGEPIPIPLLPERGYLPDLEAIPPEIAGRAKVLWLNYPNNPTGATAPLEFFTQAVAFARRYNVLVCHDAAYTLVTFGGYRAPSILQVPGAKDVAVEFNTLSKSHNMAGWRVAAAAGNPEALRGLHTLKTNLDSSHFRPVLDAATAAMLGDQNWLRQRNEEYRQRGELVLQTLEGLGWHAQMPQASLYVWAAIPGGLTSVQLVEAALEGACVSLTPGSLFGAEGEGYVRISLTAAMDRVAEAMRRLEKWMGK